MLAVMSALNCVWRSRLKMYGDLCHSHSSGWILHCSLASPCLSLYPYQSLHLVDYSPAPLYSGKFCRDVAHPLAAQEGGLGMLGNKDGFGLKKKKSYLLQGHHAGQWDQGLFPIASPYPWKD